MIRIIAPHPDSRFVTQREHDEKEVHGQIRQTIINLGEWVQMLANSALKQNRILISKME